jgi:OmpA-OmpF porin, OOP family
MTVRKLSILTLFLALAASLSAQDKSAAASAPYRSLSPDDKFELGIHLGLPYMDGDIKAQFPGFGGGVHLRKSLDHIFSVRGNVLFASTKGDDGTSTRPRTYDSRWLSGSAQIVATVNNFRFNKPYRKVGINVFAGGGFANFKTEFENIPQLVTRTDNTIQETAPHVEFGAGLSLRINPKINISLDYTIHSIFGKFADLMDAEENLGRTVTTYRDNLHYPHLSLNFNLGKNNKKGVALSEPLYWTNPMAQVAEALTALEARPIYDPTDSDSDGIIDAIDDEDNSPIGARVDSRGVTLDSDGDKVADYKDKEPYSPPGYTVDGSGVAQVPKPITETDVNRIVDAKLAAYKPPMPKTITEWFLPMINFDDNRYDIRFSEYEKLYQVATVLKQNPELKVVAVGNTDERASDRYNNVLSYNRANAAINFLVEQHGIARDRLILNWSGEGTPLIPSKGSRFQNRRVEFRVAKGETEMSRPEGPEAGKTRFKGNKTSGY